MPKAIGGKTQDRKGNDVYFTFNLKRSSGMVFTRPLRVDVSGTDFPVNAKLEYLDNVNGWVDISTFSDIDTISISYLNSRNTGDTTVQFRFWVDAQSLAATGYFRVKVNYRHYDGTSNGLSCCRMAVANEEGTQLSASDLHEYLSKPTDFKLYPNPAQNQLIVEMPGDWKSFKVVDMQGRIIQEGPCSSGKTVLSTQLFSNGLYRFVAMGSRASKSANFQILK